MLLLALLSAGEVLAQPAPDVTATSTSAEPFRAAALVVLFADDPGDAASLRLERDLQSLGFSVIRLAATPENSSDDSALERSARAVGAVAAVRLFAAARGGKLWAFEPRTGSRVTRSLPEPAASGADPNELALVTVEMLRASIMELHPPAPPPAPARPPAPPKPHADSPKPLSLSGALAVDLGLRSVGPSLTSMWSVWSRLGGCFGVRGFASFPLLAEQRNLKEGSLEVEPLLLGAGVTCSFARTGSRLWLRTSIGALGAHVVTRGTAVDPLRSSSGAAWLGGTYGMLGLGVDAAPALRVNLDATGVLLPTPATILANQREVGTWGSPAALVSLGLEVLADL